MSKIIICLLLIPIICSCLGHSRPQCRGNTHVCRPEERGRTDCPFVIDPVCGFLPGIICVQLPCRHIVFNSGCEACSEDLVKSYTKGQCTIFD